MKKIHQSLPFIFGIAMLTASPVIFSCKNSGKNTTASDSTATMSTMKSDSMRNDSMNKMKVAAPAPVKWKATSKEEEVPPKTKISEDQNHIYNFSQVMPVYPGGDSALMVYLQNNINYPRMALQNHKEGTVYVHFTIDETGKVMDAQAQGEQLGYGLDEEAVRVVSSMPAWTPGEMNGKKVKVYYRLPITYALSD